MLASLLRHKIIIQEQTDEKNEYGERLDVWDNVLTTFAGINPLTGKEFFTGEKFNSEVTHKIIMRYTPVIKPYMRIKYGDRIFSIISIINYQERNAELTVMCKELL